MHQSNQDLREAYLESSRFGLCTRCHINYIRIKPHGELYTKPKPHGE